MDVTANSGDEDFFHCIPKIELHAHLNGSLSSTLINKLIEESKKEGIQVDLRTLNLWNSITTGKQQASMDDGFKIFEIIHQLIRTPMQIKLMTKLVISDFHQENVKYLELRSTPKLKEGYFTKLQYINSILEAIKECDLDIIVKYMVSFDRGRDLHDAEDTLTVVEEIFKHDKFSREFIVGVDLSGNPSVGDARNYIPLMNRARDLFGLKISVHLGETKGSNFEIMDILLFNPDRIGHGTFLHPENGGRQEYVDIIRKNKIPIEICMTSNYVTKTITSYQDHHFNSWFQYNHPLSICTDDKGVFSTTLTNELQLVSKTFNLSKTQLHKINRDSIFYAFCTENEKSKLFAKF